MECCAAWGKRVRFLTGFGLALGRMLPADALTVRTVTRPEDSEAAVGTLRYWVKNAAAGDIIAFFGSGTSVNLTSAIVFNKNLVLAGPAAITQTGSACVFSVPAGRNVILSNLTLSGGKSRSYGGGVENFGTLQMTSCAVRNNSAGMAGGLYNEGALTMKDCTIENNTCYYSGGGVSNSRSLTMENCVVSGNTSTIRTSDGNYGGGGICTWGTATVTNCTIAENTADYGGGVHNFGTLTLRSSTVTRNTARKLGGGMYGSVGTNLFGVTVVDNTPDQMYGAYTADADCVIGSAPNKSARTFSGYAGDTEPEPRSIVGDADVATVKNALANPQSGLYAVIEQALAADLGKSIPGKSTSLAGMAATLYDANTFEDVTLTSADLSVEYTASWPSNVRYYALFARADGSGYELADRGVQFEIKAGQSLPDGVTPPDFYVPGEGLMTWKNIVTDGGSYDLNPTAGAVTIRVCSVRAAEAAGDKGSGGGCNAGAGAAPLALLLAAPLCAFVRSKGSVRK